MSHPLRQFAQAGARGGRHRVPGLSQIVQGQAGQACRIPRLVLDQPEVRPAKTAALRADEDPAVWAGLDNVSRCLRSSGAISRGKATTRRPARDFGSASNKTVSARCERLRETAGQGWLEAPLFRIGASSLLSGLFMQRRQQLTGTCSGPGYFTLG